MVPTIRRDSPLVLAALVNPDLTFATPLYDDDELLFAVGVANAALWPAVRRKLYARLTRTYQCGVGVEFFNGSSDLPIQNLPTDVYNLLPAALDMRDMSMLSATCRFFRQECAHILEQRVRFAFTWLGLDWVTFRFMLKQTGAVIGGFFVYHLVRMDFPCLCALSSVEIFVWQGVDSSNINRFFKAASPYSKLRRESSALSATRIAEAIYYRRPGYATEIAVHRCIDDLGTIFQHAKLTCLRVNMCDSRVRIATPSLTLNGTTMIGAEYVDHLSRVETMQLNHIAKKQGARMLTGADGSDAEERNDSMLCLRVA
ncbi:hypothetical protein C8R45DRAFT_939924 [Mycena sanguinolenta]|nr:hypothetical protein C8R45DRAFT_939924 [Mycena sanguinolenta]